MRALGPALESLPRRKPRGGWALFWFGRDLWGFEDRVRLGRVGGVAGGAQSSLAGGTDDGERVRSRGYAGLAQARRSKEHWRPREDIGFLLRGVGGDEGKRRCEAGRVATVMRCRS